MICFFCCLFAKQRLTSLGNFLRGLHVRTIVLACFPEGGKDRYVLNIFYGVF